MYAGIDSDKDNFFSHNDCLAKSLSSASDQMTSGSLQDNITEIIRPTSESLSNGLQISDKAEEAILQWDGLTFVVETNVKKELTSRVILNQISGHVQPGETIAIIGSSGAGKTTLLNALSGRISGGRLSGKILYCGSQRQPGIFRRATSYVQQEDIMHSLLTVQETLMYAAKLRLSNSQYSQEQKQARVEDILKQLRLEGIRNSQIGNTQNRGISGGERKRVSIGVELLTDPRILFLDEPTSGLDSNSSQLTVELVRKIVTERRIAALMTIHQPSARIFNMFDKVILLSQGHVVYFGSTASTIDYFSNIGYACPVHENPADYFVDLMTLDYRSEEALAESKMRVANLAYCFLQYKTQVRAKDYAKAVIMYDQAILAEKQESAVVIAQPTRNSWIYEYKTLAQRDWLNLMRNVPFLASQVIQSLATALIVGFMFFHLKHDSASIQNRLGVLYIVALNATFPIIMPALYAFFDERDIMLRERSAAVYRVTPFYISKATTFMPIALTSSAVFICGVYFISHLAFSTGKFFATLGVLSCLNVVSISFMLMVGSAVRTMDVAFVIAPGIITIELLFGGLLANPKTIPEAIKWIHWINPVYYAYAAFVRNEFSGLEFACIPGAVCYSNGNDVIDAYGMGRFTVGQDVAMLLVIAAIFYMAGYALLRWRAKPKFTWI
ncbi:hypothetical protein IWW38_000408 [Coemansia aciculifera]|uniref:Uncharacterized protein n=1 Tax=Coemansia aciculifera TaxID=417176 RepID=A0ACC1MAX6_9FUNG|nr:hypothetical protein IWW38_000408 [Coemansia aciculifera]